VFDRLLLILSSLPLSDRNFKCLILVISVQCVTAEQFKSTIFNSCQIRDCSRPVWYAKGEAVPMHVMRAYRREEVQIHGHTYVTTLKYLPLICPYIFQCNCHLKGAYTNVVKKFNYTGVSSLKLVIVLKHIGAN
jgi:hypothetical protein